MEEKTKIEHESGGIAKHHSDREWVFAKKKINK